VLLVLGLVTVCALFFIPFELDALRPFTEKLSDAAHFPLFVGITLAFTALFGGKRRLGALAALVLVFGIEGLQPLTGRSAGEIDIVNGVLGVFCTTVGISLVQRSVKSWLKVFYGFFVFGVTLLVFSPPLRTYQAVMLRARMFPTLASFENSVELSLWRTTGPILTSANYLGLTESWRRDGKQALVFVSKGDGFGGIEYSAGDSDWSEYQTLVIPLTISSGGAEVGVRIDDDEECDRFEDRFNRSFVLEPGEHELRIPLEDVRRGPEGRELNVKRIRRLIIFTHPHVLARQLFFDAIRLEPPPFLPPLAGGAEPVSK
jgi:hypothetical protein